MSRERVAEIVRAGGMDLDAPRPSALLHEAAHAVAYASLGCEVVDVVMTLTPGVGWGGCVRAWESDETAPRARAAGLVAESMMGDVVESVRADLDGTGARADDVRELRALTERLDLDIGDVVCQTRALLDAHWPAVEAVRDALAGRWTPGAERFGLTGDEVREEFQRSSDPRGPGFSPPPSNFVKFFFYQRANR